MKQLFVEILWPQLTAWLCVAAYVFVHILIGGL